MPCRGPELGDFVPEILELKKQINGALGKAEDALYKKLTGVNISNKDELNDVTRWLCTILHAAEVPNNYPSAKIQLMFSQEPAFKRWWEKHKELDDIRARNAAELKVKQQKRAQAISKLTDEERELLNL